MVQVMAFGFIQVDTKQEWNLDVVTLVIEARSCVGSKHDEISAYNVHWHEATDQKHGPKSIVLSKSILQWMYIEGVDAPAAMYNQSNKRLSKSFVRKVIKAMLT